MKLTLSLQRSLTFQVVAYSISYFKAGSFLSLSKLLTEGYSSHKLTVIFLVFVYFSAHKNWTLCHSWCYSKCTWSAQDTIRQDHASSSSSGCKEWEEDWWCDHHGWLFCSQELVWKQAWCWFPSLVTLFCL